MNDSRVITMQYSQYRKEIDELKKEIEIKFHEQDMLRQNQNMLRSMLRSLVAWDFEKDKLLNDEYMQFDGLPEALKHINDCINDSIGW